MHNTFTRLSAASVALLVSILISGCGSGASERTDVQGLAEWCAGQAASTLAQLDGPQQIPVSIPKDSSRWQCCSPGSWWTCGFWAGELWYLYELTSDSFWQSEALKATDVLVPVAYREATSHDVGFMVMPGLSQAFRYTSDRTYKDALESAADSLATLFNPAVGTILSWPGMVSDEKPHNTIIDNMLNLELLFWVGANCDRPDLTRIASRHAEVTMEHHFRSDHSTYHVCEYGSDGTFLGGHTHQGWKDESTWARGQAWAVYGFTMAYRFTHDPRFLRTATDAAEYFLRRLPKDRIPYWDFDAGEQLEDQPRDCSAAAVVASALLELRSYLPRSAARRYTSEAASILESLSNPPYRASDSCPSLLLHSTGHKPHGTEVDASISYADYYYTEALARMKNLQQ